MEKEEIIEGLKRSESDFVANNYYKMTKEQLKELVIDAIYVLDKEGVKKFINEVEEYL